MKTINAGETKYNKKSRNLSPSWKKKIAENKHVLGVVIWPKHTLPHPIFYNSKCGQITYCVQ